MIAEIMKRYFPRTLFTGNDRRTEQALSNLSDAKKDDWLVLEISNRQLKIDLERSPDISVITNITPNHMMEHRDFEDYAKTKASILHYQRENQWSVLNQDDPQSRKLIEIDGGETFPFSTEEVLPRGVFVEFSNIIIKHGEVLSTVMPVTDFPLLGKHNLSNALAATAATYLAEVPIEVIAQTLRSLEPIPQRLEPIATIEGVTFYNDTAATVPQATSAALEALKKQGNALHLIMGGRSKGISYEDLAKKITTEVTTLVLLKSPLAEEMKALLQGTSVNVMKVDTLQKAVSVARSEAHPGDSVLLSPAGEYFVYFRDKMPGYKNFRDIVERLK
jgi:UDP-N-acetylmuramoylalanine--D-glutamate ligase